MAKTRKILNSVQYLSAEEIIGIHDRFIQKTSGLLGIRDAHLVCSIAEKPKMSFGGVEMYAEVYIKAAVLLESIATYHPFTDGNKRTALAVALLFLKRNGVKSKLETASTLRFMLAVATKKKTIKHIAAWLKEHSALD